MVYTKDGKFRRTIQMRNLMCAIGFDRHGDLWVSSGQDGQLLKLDRERHGLGRGGKWRRARPGTGHRNHLYGLGQARKSLYRRYQRGAGDAMVAPKVERRRNPGLGGKNDRIKIIHGCRMRVGRRDVLGATGALFASATAAIAQRAEEVPTRNSGPVEVVYKAPHGQPNGLAQGPNPGELWVQDRGTGRQVTLIHAADGSIIREITADAIGPSGITMDDEGVMWTSDTHGVMLVSFDASDGHTIAKYFVPGACRMFEKAGDAPRRVSKLKPAYPVNRAPWATTFHTMRETIPVQTSAQARFRPIPTTSGVPPARPG